MRLRLALMIAYFLVMNSKSYKMQISCQKNWYDSAVYFECALSIRKGASERFRPSQPTLVSYATNHNVSLNWFLNDLNIEILKNSFFGNYPIT